MSKAIIAVGLGFGDESKGSCVDRLTREYPVDTIVRFNGGAQAAHHVTSEDGTVHCFSQFGSGTLASPTVKTHLSRFVLVEPISMMREAQALSDIGVDVWHRTTVDAKAAIITPYHRLLNRLREHARGDKRHGSCGRGIGVTREMHLAYGTRVLLAGDTRNNLAMLDKLHFIRSLFRTEISNHPEYGDVTEPDLNDMLYAYRQWPVQIVDSLEPSKCMVFEGAQGVMLDETFGTAPHNTWTDTTFNNADTLLDEIGVRDRTRIGCLRSYYTRHGHGPFPTEDNTLDLPELHNGTGMFQGGFRVGYFDFDLAKHALSIVGGVDYLALSHLDYLPRLGLDTNFPNVVEEVLDTPIGMWANGPTAAHRRVAMSRVGAYV